MSAFRFLQVLFHAPAESSGPLPPLASTKAERTFSPSARHAIHVPRLWKAKEIPRREWGPNGRLLEDRRAMFQVPLMLALGDAGGISGRGSETMLTIGISMSILYTVVL